MHICSILLHAFLRASSINYTLSRQCRRILCYLYLFWIASTNIFMQVCYDKDTFADARRVHFSYLLSFGDDKLTWRDVPTLSPHIVKTFAATCTLLLNPFCLVPSERQQRRRLGRMWCLCGSDWKECEHQQEKLHLAYKLHPVWDNPLRIAVVSSSSSSSSSGPVNVHMRRIILIWPQKGNINYSTST